MPGADETSDRCLKLFRLTVITTFICLSVLTIILYCIKKIGNNSGTANAAFILSLATLVCAGSACITELLFVSASISAVSLAPELKSKFMAIDGRMFL